MPAAAIRNPAASHHHLCFAICAMTASSRRVHGSTAHRGVMSPVRAELVSRKLWAPSGKMCSREERPGRARGLLQRVTGELGVNQLFAKTENNSCATLGVSLRDTRLLPTSRNLMAGNEINRKRGRNPKK